MKKYKNVLLSLGFFILAPVWVLLLEPILYPLLIKISSLTPYTLGILLVTWPYITFFAAAIFFGLKKNSPGAPSVIGRIVLIVGIIVLSIPLLYIYWASGWSA